jgi:membrane protease YdiL (CAAX protease family)
VGLPFRSVEAEPPDPAVVTPVRPVRRERPQREQRLIAVVAVVFGAAFVGATLRLPRGSASFYAAGYALAFVWLIASLACGGASRRSTPHRGRDLFLGVVVAVVAFAAFVLAAAVGRQIDALAGPIDALLGKADAGPVAAVLALALVNGIAEELFFRGVLVDAIGGRRAALLAVVVYVGVTAVAGNTALTLAAIVMGTVFVVERMRTSALTASITTHLVWSTLMILALPR